MSEVEQGPPASTPEVVPTESEVPVETEAAAAEASEAVVAPEMVTSAVEAEEDTPWSSDHKRKHEELENEGVDEAVKEDGGVALEAETGDGNDGEEKEHEFVQNDADDTAGGESKRQRVDEEVDVSAENGHRELNMEMPAMVNGTASSTDNLEQAPLDEHHTSFRLVSEQGETNSAEQQPGSELPTSSRKIEVPNNKVGVLIGKAGDTIRYLQYNSGAKIQIVRDADADPHSSTRSVELIGALECINKAEQLIKDVIAEADAGGSPALVARGFGTAQSGAEQLEIQVPNEKVGLIIGKGGENIKNLQTRSGARIQLIPQHLPEGDPSKVRTVRISGNKKHIETATEMIQEVMNQIPGRSSSLSTGHNQQFYRPRGSTPTQWGPRAMAPMQPTTGYGYQQRGMYPSQTHYPRAYGGYQQQPPPRGSYGAGWDQRPPAQDYYGHGGPPTNSQPSGPVSAPAAAPPPTAGTYYGQPQGPGYGQPQGPYPQSMSTQNYGHGYSEPKYDGQAPSQPMYGQQPLSSGPYSQSAYQQQPYNRPPAYGGVPSQGPTPAYGQPRPAQPGDQMYQGATPAYGSGGPPQPYVSGAPQATSTAYAQPYGGTADGYMQQPASGYNQQGGTPAAGYAQPGQTAAMYPQAGQSGGYGQYPQPQPNYAEQPMVTSNTNYGYQGTAPDPAYGSSTPGSGYVAPAATVQAGYTQPPANPSGYDQSVAPQSGYASYPGNAPVGYT